MSSSEEDRPAVVAVHDRYKTRISRSQHANEHATAPAAVLQRGVQHLHHLLRRGLDPTRERLQQGRHLVRAQRSGAVLVVRLEHLGEELPIDDAQALPPAGLHVLHALGRRRALPPVRTLDLLVRVIVLVGDDRHGAALLLTRARLRMGFKNYTDHL